MKKTIISFFISCLSIIAFGQANTYFHDRIDTTLFAIADTVGHGSNHYYATNLTPDFNVKQYVNGCTVNLFFKKGNTGSATLTLVTKTGTLSSKTIRKANGQVLLSGDIPDSTAVILDYYNGSFRIAGIGVTASSSSWLLTGNSGTTAGTNFIGTIDSVDFVFKVNNRERARINRNGGSFTLGATSITQGKMIMKGLTSGSVTITPAAAAGDWIFTLPTDDGTASQFLQTDGSGITSWQTVTPATIGAWSITGNSGTTAGINFLGTTDAQDLVFKYNSSEKARINSLGFGINTGTTTPTAYLNVVSTGTVIAAEIDSGSNYIFRLHNTGQLELLGNINFRNTIAGYNAGLLINPCNVMGCHGGSYHSGDGVDNTIFGYSAGESLTIGSANNLFGTVAGRALTTGIENVAIGQQALTHATVGSDNIAIGEDALNNNISGSDNTAIGPQAINTCTVCSGSVGVGSGALNDYNEAGGLSSTAVGYQSLYNLVSGRCSAFGYKALFNATGTLNSAFGNNSLLGITNGTNNTGMGNYVIAEITTGTDNVGIGFLAGSGFQGASSYNTIIGSGSSITGVSRTASRNTFLGYGTGLAAHGDGNVFLGYGAGTFETGSNKLFIDNATRSSEADARIKALIYGGFGTDSSSQFIKVNGEIRFTKGIDVTAGDAATVQGQVGQFVKDASGTTFTLTNALIKSNSIILLTWAGDPGGGTAHDISVVAGTGSAVITFGVAPTGSTAVNFAIFNNN